MVRIVVLLATLAALTGCNRGDMQNKEAVRQAVIDYLSSRTNLNVSSMNVDVTSVSFQNNQAEATVAFAPKGANAAGQGMSMRYTLERQGNKWVVKGKGDSGKSPHGGTMGGEGMGSMPPGHPSMPPAEKGAMPPGHPTMPPAEKGPAPGKK